VVQRFSRRGVKKRYGDFATVGNHDALGARHPMPKAIQEEEHPIGALGSVPCRINPREMCFALLVVRYLIASVFMPRTSASDRREV